MSTSSQSLRSKVILNVFSTSVLLLFLFGALIFTQLNNLTHEVSKETLVEQARKIASYLEQDWRGRLDLDLPRRYIDYYGGSTPFHQFAVTDASGNFLFRSENFMKDKIKDTNDEGGKHFFDFITEEGHNYTGLKYDYLFDDKIYPIYIIENEQEFASFLAPIKKSFIVNVASYGLPLLFLQGLLIVFIFRESLKPVLQISKDANNIKYDNLSFRLNGKGVPSEISPLIHSVNEGLSRLEQSAEAQKFFIANAAHELRTPIAILKARIAGLSNEQDILLLNQDLRDINRLISQILDMSRLDVSESLPMEQVNLNEVAKHACEDMGALFVTQKKDLTFEEKGAAQLISGNEDTLFRAILNLLENALKHTPEETPVKVIVEDKSVTVRDYGNPIPEDYKLKIFEHFEKSPENFSANGSGLGLAIVKKAAEIHGGTISVVSRKNGNDFVLDF